MAELKQLLGKMTGLNFMDQLLLTKTTTIFQGIVLNTCYAKEWIPYCKKPFDGCRNLSLGCLGKYTPPDWLSATTESKA
ncbi:MAG: hypothetical protein ACLU6Y_09330 [Ruminococcus sp.]